MHGEKGAGPAFSPFTVGLATQCPPFQQEPVVPRTFHQAPAGLDESLLHLVNESMVVDPP
jgi:hypothetical protein